MTHLRDWIDQRTGLCSAWRDWLRRPLGGRPAWRRVWPGTIAFVFFTQVVTGWRCGCSTAPARKAPGKASTTCSTTSRAAGCCGRSITTPRKVMLALVGVWLVEMIFRGAYRAPREAIFWTVVLMGLVTLALNLTGDLLPWDQNGYWSTRVRTGFLLLLPGVGRRLFELAAGGADFGHLTLTRFVALHVGVFSGGLGCCSGATPGWRGDLDWNEVRRNRRQRRKRGRHTGRGRPRATRWRAWPSWP